MRVLKSIERKSQLLGLGFSEIGLIILLFAVLFIIGNLLGVFIAIPGLYYLCSMGVVIICTILLRYNNKKKQPTYLLSLISFYCYQPKHITVQGKTND